MNAELRRRAVESLRAIASNPRDQLAAARARDSLSKLGVKIEDAELPAPVLESINGLMIVRDDLLEGGSKRRFLRPLIESEGMEWVYASPRQGYGQVSLAYVCRDVAKRATVFVAESQRLHPLTELAATAGAQVVQVKMGYRAVCEARAREYVAATAGAVLAPFGFHCELVIGEIARIARALPIKPPREVWSIVSSGTLTNGLQRAWPKAKFFGVFVGHKPTAQEQGRAKLYKAPEKYEQNAKTPPPFPSAINYDAKAWQFITKHASKGALFWNVGR